MSVVDFRVMPLSMIPRALPDHQQVIFSCESAFAGRVSVAVSFEKDAGKIFWSGTLHLQCGSNRVTAFVPIPEQAGRAVWTLSRNGTVLAEYRGMWSLPRQWEMYFTVASHTDIGLHNSQYIQRHNCSRFLDQAIALVEETEKRERPEDRYHYAMEGTWFWNNYGMDQGREKAASVVQNYIRTGKIALAAGLAGNHTQVYGMEQLCRTAYEREKLLQEWGVDSRTLTMIDNNGISWSLVAPYVSAGYRNLFFSPNHWNPLLSTVNPIDSTAAGYLWNSDAGGGGSRCDVRFASALPMLFYWLAPDGKSKLLFWASPQYEYGSTTFGIHARMNRNFAENCLKIEQRMAEMLPLLEKKYPYDIWCMACYADDQEPEINLCDNFAFWNEKWLFPKLRMTGNYDEPFEKVRAKFGDQIPVLSGDITGGWYQHPLSTPELLARKFAVDRALPTAEKLAVLAAHFNPEEYTYPATAFNRAWYALFCNDEHSYGTSGYQGKRVYETWMQHRAWIEQAERTATEETDKALKALAEKITVCAPATLVFNPMGTERKELVNGCMASLPPFGYILMPKQPVQKEKKVPVTEPPVIENRWYKITFAPDGAMEQVYDKELKRDLFSAPANRFIYTNDNHKTFFTPGPAQFTVTESTAGIKITARMDEAVSGAMIVQQVFLPKYEKRIDVDNILYHVRDLINNSRYQRYGYYAFPFRVENGIHKVHLNGCVASPITGQTAHGTDCYLAAREWTCVENGSFGAALLQLDSQLVEFGEMHADKTEYRGENRGSAVYSALFNDWLQMHTPGGSYINPRFRYTIVSYSGSWQQAGIAKMAERMANPVLTLSVREQKGSLPPQKSFGAGKEGFRFLALKRAEDGNGIIARFQEMHGMTGTADFELNFASGMEECSVDERKIEPVGETLPFGTRTCRLTGVDLPERKQTKTAENPAPIGSVYTGLIDEPRAACGEGNGHLYLLWGQNPEKDLDHYELYRSIKPGFQPDSTTFVADVEPGPYRVVSYEDRELENHTTYYYRVCAVNQKGVAGPFSSEFCGITREV